MPVAESNKLAASDELLMRQVHPNCMQEGRLWSGAFTPTKADKGLLSADRESIMSPKDAYERYLAAKALTQAGGSWGVSINEFKALDLACYSDPIADNNAHVLVDFAAKGAENEKRLGKLAYAKANARGRLYP
ncbi:hypothetical protein [Xanthomonas euvesicatoria]|uniref:hypothetical protein n=1 Tax=Xanthomonas euvesicatoria TaxID=456327 RepID=UPI001C480E3D|nr:hypothetical protein [Xanthomonas euvesicatoria]MBV6865448.1 hypothetical protein [Xanthomonas campestris pv. coriandri]MCE4327708.1 hypothetical protein [Xanthomonas campestris pv. coriandri]